MDKKDMQLLVEQYYKFTTIINEEGQLEFCLNRVKITYEILPKFINIEVEKNKEKIKRLQEKNAFEMERLLLLEESTKKQNEEYTKKEKQSVFLFILSYPQRKFFF